MWAITLPKNHSPQSRGKEKKAVAHDRMKKKKSKKRFEKSRNEKCASEYLRPRKESDPRHTPTGEEMEKGGEVKKPKPQARSVKKGEAKNTS